MPVVQVAREGGYLVDKRRPKPTLHAGRANYRGPHAHLSSEPAEEIARIARNSDRLVLAVEKRAEVPLPHFAIDLRPDTEMRNLARQNTGKHLYIVFNDREDNIISFRHVESLQSINLLASASIQRLFQDMLFGGEQLQSKHHHSSL